MARHKGPRKPPGQKKPPLTHFLCLPLVTPTSKPQLQSSLRQFRDAVAVKDQGSTQRVEETGEDGNSETIIPGVHPKAIRPVGALHCTLGVMSLSKQELDKAIELLETLDVQSLLKQAAGHHKDELKVPESQSLEAKDTPADAAHSSLERPISPPPVSRSEPPLKVDLKGLVSMHTPRKTSILYSAPSDASERLYPLCLAVQKLFKDKGLLVPDDRELKLHATIVNTIYAKGRHRRPPRHKEPKEKTPERAEDADQPEGSDVRDDAGEGQQGDRSQGHGPNANAPLKIDATAILERYKEFVWAENVTIDRIAICEMGAKKITNAQGEVVSEEYTEVGKVALPTA